MAVSTHSRPKAAGGNSVGQQLGSRVSTHSRPKAAGSENKRPFFSLICFNTQPPEGGWRLSPIKKRAHLMFQHTAARRRLDTKWLKLLEYIEFQHTAARRRLAERLTTVARGVVFQHTAARRRLDKLNYFKDFVVQFQHTAARRRLAQSTH